MCKEILTYSVYVYKCYVTDGIYIIQMNIYDGKIFTFNFICSVYIIIMALFSCMFFSVIISMSKDCHYTLILF